MTGSWPGRPRFSASRAIQAAMGSLGASSPGYGFGPPAPAVAASAAAATGAAAAGAGCASGIANTPEAEAGPASGSPAAAAAAAASSRRSAAGLGTAANTPDSPLGSGARGRRGGRRSRCRGRRRGCRRRGRAGGRVALDADEDGVRVADLARDGVDRVRVVALQRREPAALHGAVEEPDVAVGAEVGLAAEVVGDDVPGPRLLGAHDLEAVVALLGVADPGLHRRPAGPRHLVPGLPQRPGHERRAPRVAGRHLRRREVLLDLRPQVGAADLADPALGLRDLQRRRPERVRPRSRRPRAGAAHRRRRPRRRARRPRRRAAAAGRGGGWCRRRVGRGGRSRRGARS